MTKLNSALILSTILLLFTSCMNTDTHRLLGSLQGEIRILATDAPIDYEELSSAQITLTQIELLSNEENRIEHLLKEEVGLDLLQLKNGILSTLNELKIPVGEYHQLKLHFKDALLTFKDGTQIELEVPLGAASGVLVRIHPLLKVNSRIPTDLLLDFDLSRSLLLDADENFQFSPTVRAANLSSVGAIQGHVHTDTLTPGDASDDRPLGGALVSLSSNGSIIATAITGPDGFFKLMALEEGNYTLKVSEHGHAPTELNNVFVEEGHTAEENIVLQDLTVL